MLPLGEMSVGASGTVGPVALTVIAFAGLHGLVPRVLEAFTNQLYVAPFVSEVVGVNWQMPVPPPHPMVVALRLTLTATPAVFCTSR